MGLMVMLVLLNFCNESGNQKPGLPYANLHDSVQYVGKEPCRACHVEHYNSFSHTGMGLSFGLATKEKSSGIFGPDALVFDTLSNLYYKPFWRNDSLIVVEYRLQGTDTIHHREEAINYIIGSGHHTNSHFIQRNGYLFQAPITFYTQQGKWDMAPGFSGGFNSRFSRAIEAECITCHNALPKQNNLSKNRFTHLPQGIDCERCHGPGEIHVAKQKNKPDPGGDKQANRSIVNPAKLNRDLQMSLCKRCHLQGVAVLKPGKQFSDFKPGMLLSDVMQVFLPGITSKKNAFLMASHAERLEESQCFANSDLSCITCHNPHESVLTQNDDFFNRKCLACHESNSRMDCGLEPEARQEKGNSCITCHMPKSGSIDIPHVSITDHNIQILPGKIAQSVSDNSASALGLRALAGGEVSSLEMAKAYLKFYEGFEQNTAYLDSAGKYLAKSSADNLSKISVEIHLNYLQKNYEDMATYVSDIDIQTFTDADNLFRLGEALDQIGQHAEALGYFKAAIRLQPENPDFLNRYGASLVSIGKPADALNIFNQLISLMPIHAAGYCNAGILKINLGEAEEGVKLLNRAISLDPDYELAYLNLLEYYWRRYDKESARLIWLKMKANIPKSEAAIYWGNRFK